MREMTQSLTNNKELDRLRSKKRDLCLLKEGGEKQLKVIQASNEEKQVEENLLRLKVNQVEKSMSSIDGKVYNLEKYRLQIEAVSKQIYLLFNSFDIFIEFILTFSHFKFIN